MKKKPAASATPESAAAAKNARWRMQIALICGIAQWVLLATAQSGNFFGYLLPPIERDYTAVTYFFTVILFIQAQNALASAAIGGLAYVCARYVVTRWLFFTFYVLECAFLLIDQVYYKVFLDHVRLGAFEAGQQFNATITFGSFTREVDAIFYLSAAVALIGLIWLGRALVSPLGRPKRPALTLEVSAVLLLCGLPSYSSKKHGHLNENPVIDLGLELERGSVENFLAKQAPTATVNAASSGEVDHDPRLSEYLTSLRAQHPRPNLVLIVLESVGSLNLFSDRGRPSEVFTPTLAHLAAAGVSFDTLYTTFPGTTRSLITLHTGGRQVTYSGMTPVLHQYQGPLLPRAIGDLGYDTALFSGERLDGEGTDVFLKQAGYAKYYDFAMDAVGRQPQNFIHSWGAREEYTQSQIRQWMDARPANASPFYLEYMNAATHHPYGAPPGFHMPLPPEDLEGGRKSDYLNAMAYTDRAIQALLGDLDARGVLKNTLIAVTGDHGEAFGDIHPNNYLHKNFTYDENIRDFLILADGESFAAGRGSAIRSSRIGSTADIMPTLLAALGAPPPDVPGRNLLIADFDPQIVYFHKLAEPETWGLRDGRWKYIAEIRTGLAQLYDLAADPAEHNNLAGQQPDRVARYTALCRSWYLQSDRDYTLRLKDYQMVDDHLIAGDRLGARILSTGYLAKDASFIETTVVNPKQTLLAWAKWTRDPLPNETTQWVSPSGKAFESKLLQGPEFHVTLSAYPGPLPMEEGDWTIRLKESDGVHLTEKFVVRPSAAVHGD